MKNYTITVNGNVYEVTVEEGFTGAASAPKAAAPAPKAAPKAPAAAPAPVQTAAPAAAPARTAAPAAGNAANDGELVAVITAAIAAATGVPADSVNIRSITRK